MRFQWIYPATHEIYQKGAGRHSPKQHVLWAAGNYYILAKPETSSLLTHFRIDMLKDICLLETGVDMIFGGINPGQYAAAKIILKGETKEHYSITCPPSLWQEIADLFGTDAALLQKSGQWDSSLKVRIYTIPSQMCSFVMSHLTECEVTAPKRFRDEIQETVLAAYKMYW